MASKHVQNYSPFRRAKNYEPNKQALDKLGKTTLGHRFVDVPKELQTNPRAPKAPKGGKK